MSIRYLVKEFSGGLFSYQCTACGHSTPPASPVLHPEQGIRTHIAAKHRGCPEFGGKL